MHSQTSQSRSSQTPPPPGSFPGALNSIDCDSFVGAIQLVRVPPDEVASVVELRKEIDLSVHLAAGPDFESLEKKETSAASYLHSTCMASASARFASCRWATA